MVNRRSSCTASRTIRRPRRPSLPSSAAADVTSSHPGFASLREKEVAMSLIANAEQAAAWDGPEGDHWTEHAEHYEQTTRHHRGLLLSAGLLSPGDDVLDVGCGTGALTREAARHVPTGQLTAGALGRWCAANLTGTRRLADEVATAAAGVRPVRPRRVDDPDHWATIGGA